MTVLCLEKIRHAAGSCHAVVFQDYLTSKERCLTCTRSLQRSIRHRETSCIVVVVYTSNFGFDATSKNSHFRGGSKRLGRVLNRATRTSDAGLVFDLVRHTYLEWPSSMSPSGLSASKTYNFLPRRLIRTALKALVQARA